MNRVKLYPFNPSTKLQAGNRNVHVTTTRYSNSQSQNMRMSVSGGGSGFASTAGPNITFPSATSVIRTNLK